MSFRFRLSVLVLGALALSACNTTTLLDADFDADTPGRFPNPSPPGPPSGDAIEVFTLDPIALQVSAMGISGNSLLYRLAPDLNQATFIGPLPSRRAPRYWAAWNGRAEDFTDLTPAFNFTFGNFEIGLAMLEIEGNVFRVGGTAIGDVVLGGVHTVIMMIDTAAGTYTVSIVQPGSSPISAGPAPVLNAGVVARAADIRLTVFTDNDGVAYPATYLLDTVLITEAEPDM